MICHCVWRIASKLYSIDKLLDTIGMISAAYYKRASYIVRVVIFVCTECGAPLFVHGVRCLGPPRLHQLRRVAAEHTVHFAVRPIWNVHQCVTMCHKHIYVH